MLCLTQEYSKNLGQVVAFVVSHQALPLKVALITQLMNALVLPSPSHYRPLLRRCAALGASFLPRRRISQLPNCTPRMHFQLF